MSNTVGAPDIQLQLDFDTSQETEDKTGPLVKKVSNVVQFRVDSKRHRLVPKGTADEASRAAIIAEVLAEAKKLGW